MKSFIVLCLFTFIVASDIKVVTKYNRFNDDSLKYTVNFFTGIWEGLVNSFEATVDDFKDCYGAFHCLYETFSDFIVTLREMKPFSFEGFVNATIKYVLMGTYECSMPCLIPGFIVYRFGNLFSNSTNKWSMFVITGLAISAQDLISVAMDLFTSIIRGDFYQFGFDIGTLIWLVTIK